MSVFGVVLHSGVWSDLVSGLPTKDWPAGVALLLDSKPREVVRERPKGPYCRCVPIYFERDAKTGTRHAFCADCGASWGAVC